METGDSGLCVTLPPVGGIDWRETTESRETDNQTAEFV